MLVLTRRTGECVRIADSIVIKVVKCQGGRVRLGIEAPTCMRIRRGELELAEECKPTRGAAATQALACVGGGDN